MTTLRALQQSRSATDLTMCDEVRLTHASLAIAIIFAIVALAGATLAVAEPRGATAKSFFLVASRNMPDPVFQQSVILMLPPDEPPLVAGVIINKPTNVTLGNLFRQPL